MPPPARGPGARAREGRAATAVLFALVLGALAWGVREWDRRAEAGGFAWIQPDRVRLAPPEVVLDEAGRAVAPWVDPRWGQEAGVRLAGLAPFRADDRDARLALATALADLSFVARAALPEVIWPDGLRVPIQLRQPVACVRLDDTFRAVDSQGVLLSGNWDAPPRRDGGWLPLVRIDETRSAPGSTGALDDHLRDGLATAVSYWRHVAPDDRERLGRLVIEPAEARSAALESGGVHLRLDGERTAFFGRPPDRYSPGELPVERKWRALLDALALLPPGGTSDWELVDLRWDRPELRLRVEPAQDSERR